MAEGVQVHVLVRRSATGAASFVPCRDERCALVPRHARMLAPEMREVVGMLFQGKPTFPDLDSALESCSESGATPRYSCIFLPD